MEEEKKKYNCQIIKEYINVPYKQRQIAKTYGAWWDPEKKLWYIPKKKDGNLLRSVNYDKLRKIFGKEIS